MRRGLSAGFLRHRFRYVALGVGAACLVVGLVSRQHANGSDASGSETKATTTFTLNADGSLKQQASGASLPAPAVEKAAAGEVQSASGAEKAGQGQVADAGSANDATEFNAISEEDLQVPKDDSVGSPVADNGPDWQTYTVAKGDTFSGILDNWSVSYSTVLALLKAAPSQKLLTSLRPGDEMEYQQDSDGNLLALRIPDGRAKNYLFTREKDGGYKFESIKKPVIHYREYYAGTVHGTLVESAKKAGLSRGLTAEFIKIMGDRVDFRRQTRQGDTFAILIDREWLNGKPLDQEKVLVAEYKGKRTHVTAILAKDGDYYTPNGKGIARAFMRYPFHRHYRISSSFNWHRRNPVTHRIEPHLGTDFAMPRGSRVLAPADGVVVKTGHQRYAGNYIVIQHGRRYQTRYFHLSHILVHRGEKVKMGEKIALSGNTGRSTGPHLHYEIRIFNKPVNAMRVKLPRHTGLSGKQLARFKSHSKTLLAQLDQNVGVMLASNDHGHNVVRVR